MKVPEAAGELMYKKPPTTTLYAVLEPTYDGGSEPSSKSCVMYIRMSV